VHLYNAGYAAADGAWREKALEAQLAAARADLDAARRAAGDEALRAASIQQQAEQERAGTDAYVEDLKTILWALALSAAMICAGCASNPAPAPLARQLPAAPVRLLNPVPVPATSLNDDARARLAQTRDALGQANRRLEEGRAWYEVVRQGYGGGCEVTEAESIQAALARHGEVDRRPQNRRSTP
jgi:hypothetical protein